MSKFKPVWAGLAVLVVMGILLSFAPVRAVASQFLSLFRVRKFAVVPIDFSTMESFNSADAQEQISKIFSDDVKVLREPGEPVAVASAEEASQKAGVQVRLPAALGAPSGLEVQGALEMRYQINAARARELLSVVDRDDLQIPSGLDGATVHVNIEPVVVAYYKSGDQKYSLIQATSPSIDLPPGIDVNILGEALLQLWGVPPAKAHEMAATIDWTSTLVIPLPDSKVTYHEVAVEGSSGMFIETQERDPDLPHTSMLLWQKDNIVYALSGPVTLDQALEIVGSLQ